MEPGDNTQVSEAPLISNQPTPRRGTNVPLFFILFCLIALVAGGTLLWLDSQKIKLNDHNTQWPNGNPHEFRQLPQADYTKATAHMQLLADAMLAYRESPMGGHVRWPASIDELKAAGLLDAEFEVIGQLSRRELVYQPEMPIGHDPERWVMCHDVEIGWNNTPNGFRIKGPRAAVVILGDGSVKLLKDDELESYAGLNLLVDAAG
ncbi:MAG: hypothetical protein KDB32_02155 [Planctomycetes bacterium]|nr:hypothetical protein [Planctomycetota bacterium]MCA8946303.1 hypothetical protein [Planctomycetota bacterium]